MSFGDCAIYAGGQAEIVGIDDQAGHVGWRSEKSLSGGLVCEALGEEWLGRISPSRVRQTIPAEYRKLDILPSRSRRR